ncbi:Nucleoside diphosphate kinase [Parasponia andersonii]|uniref:Nucleoside diphosphate kinase n=1 Tax=Parasponia andersonii TaxID=3476 RepID=A0A2P5B467_PARAD|nr:Nucleoside diphosphate kinase [Parasponia andersonii]
MAAEFSSCVDYGVRLSKRIYYGKELRPPVPPPPPLAEEQTMTRSSPPEEYLPSAPMVYAVVPEPAIVDNPDVPSYQPYVHGRCEPPALVPLHMYDVAMEIEACLDTAFVSVTGTWRVHCIMAGKRCECCIAVPMGEKGSLLGVEVEVTGRSYRTQLIRRDDIENVEKLTKAQDGNFLRCHIYTFKIPKVEGGSFLSVRASWSQKLVYEVDQFCLRVPFSFPSYVNPVGKKVSMKERILLKINSGTGTQILCKSTSHPLKEIKRQVDKLNFSYEAEVPAWSSANFNFSYALSSSDFFGGVLLQSPNLRDFDEREMFCLYLFPGNNQTRKVFGKEVVFVIDISGSMRGVSLENVKNALMASLSNLSPRDTFNIIAFSGEVCLFSPSMELATKEAIIKATEWVNISLVANGGTNILLPIKQAIKLLAKTSDSIPFIFLITDGSVEDEREICSFVKSYLTNVETVCPRICTFGIGLYCNHYFLQMLAQIGKGYYDAAFDSDSIDSRIQRLFSSASSVILADITLNTLEHLDSLELFPSNIPDLSTGSPLIVSGRYDGNFPDIIKVSGTLADLSNFTVDLKVQKAKDMPLNRMLARRQIDMLTSQAWLTESKEIEEKVAKMSKQTGVPSEYTLMLLVQPDKGKKAPDSVPTQEVNNKLKQKAADANKEQMLFLGRLGMGFGDVAATAANKLPVTEEPKREPTDMWVMAASNCCSRVLNRIFRMPLSKFLFLFILISVYFSYSYANTGKERTLAIIKPDGLLDNYTDKIKNVIVEAGFIIFKEITLELDKDGVSSFYAEHSSKSFFHSLIKYMTSGPVLVMILEKENAIADWRALIGPTDARKAKITHPHSIRAICGVDSERNCVHGSDSPQSAQREISFFFLEKSAGKILPYD